MVVLGADLYLPELNGLSTQLSVRRKWNTKCCHAAKWEFEEVAKCGFFTAHVGLCLTMGVLLMAPVPSHCIPPRELDWCADTHSRQGADEDKTCSCLLETPVVAWHPTKGRKKGPNFWGFFLFLEEF